MLYNFLTKELLEKEYAELDSCVLIAKKYGISTATVWRYAQKFGVAIKSAVKYKDILTEDFIKRVYAELGSIDAISEAYNIPETTIWSYCHKYGVLKPRNKYTVNENIF